MLSVHGCRAGTDPLQGTDILVLKAPSPFTGAFALERGVTWPAYITLSIEAQLLEPELLINTNKTLTCNHIETRMIFVAYHCVFVNVSLLLLLYFKQTKKN